MRVLLEHGADPSAKTNSRKTALHLVVEFFVLVNFLDDIYTLLEYNIDISIKDKHGRTTSETVEHLIDQTELHKVSVDLTCRMQKKETLESVRDLLSKSAVQETPS
jgi:hypothetical protein